MSLIQLNEDEEDALREIINIGAGTAAKVLSEMMSNAPIDLGIPKVTICSFSELGDKLVEKKIFAGIKLDFHDAYEGSAILVFPEDSANRIVELIMKEMGEDGEIEAMREGTLSEIGNIVVSGLMGTIANMVTNRFEYSLPIYAEGDISQEFFGASTDSAIISADVNFSVSSIESNCELYIVFQGENVKDFLGAVLDFFEG